MDYRKIIKEIGRGKNHARDLDRDTARGLYAHMLNSEVPDLELGGVLIALRIKGEGGSRDARLLRSHAKSHHQADAACRQADADCHPQLQRRA